MEKFKRIIAFGDSQTYGYYLTKENNGYGTGPNQESWPFIVGNFFDLKVINNGICGASNKEIWLEAINFDYSEQDLVLILWSFFDRDFFPTGETRDNIIGFNGHYEGEKFIPNYFSNQKNKDYYKKYHTEYNSHISFGLFKSHLGMYLNSKNISYIFKNLTLPGLPTKDFKWDNINCSCVEYNLEDFAFDKKHYGPSAHKSVASYFIGDINDKIT